MVLTDYTKGFIVGAYKSGKTASEIITLVKENELAASKTSIYDLLNSFKVNERLLTPRKSTGRPKLIGEDTGKKITMEIENDRNLTAHDIYKNKKINHNDVSYQTVNNFINSQGYSAVIKKNQLSLSDKNVSERIKFANEFQLQSPNYVNKIFFSDESKLYCERSGRDYVRKHEEEDWNSRPEFHQIVDMYHSGNEIMVWGLINSKGPIKLILIDGRLNSEAYLKIIKENVSNKRKLLIQGSIFQQDNAPCHTSKLVKEYFKTSNINVLDWPSKSPDLNVIEQTWSFIKDYLFKKREKIKTKEDVWEYSQKAFYSKKCRDLIKLMYQNYYKRIEQVIEQEGKQTNY